jgi:starch phosphorylase
MVRITQFISHTHIAYFSMEIALRSEMHTYAGGLGVLAGDTVRSCADLNLPLVFITLISREGYLRQEIDDDGRQVDLPDPWHPTEWANPLDAKIALSIEGRDVWVRPWLYRQDSPFGGSGVPVILLDTDVEENDPADRKITHHLYGGDQTYRLKQEIVLGIGGMRILKALGFKITTFHLNEGHAALLTLELLQQYRRAGEEIKASDSASDTSDDARVRDHCIFTTHTPVGAGHDRFDYDLVERVLGGIDLRDLKRLGGEDVFNLTKLALNLSGYVNGVAQRHAQTARQAFPGYQIHAITNGVHVPTWTHPSFCRLYQASILDWAYEPEALAQAERLSDAAVWEAHQESKSDLIARVRIACGVEMDLNVPILGFARRMTGYKRPELLFSNVEWLTTLAQSQPFQIVLAGKAHPHDREGKELIERINGHIRNLANQIRIAFVPNYDLTIAASLVSGADIWLNTPAPPLEASGTSGMKAALNGVLNLSVLDGWWSEACIEGVTGWAIGDGTESKSDSEALYTKLSQQVLPTYSSDRARWIWMMKQSISKIGSHFNTQRMVRRYATEAYFRTSI